MKHNDIYHAFKAAGISRPIGRTSYYPQTEKQDDKVDSFTDNLIARGFTRTCVGEYRINYVKGNTTVEVSARFGIGYKAVIGVVTT